MVFEGGCYCGAIRYRAEGEPILEGQCHCRECQYISGGEPNAFIALPSDGLTYTQGNPAAFTRSDVPNPVTRRFCPTCGTSLATEIPGVWSLSRSARWMTQSCSIRKSPSLP